MRRVPMLLSFLIVIVPGTTLRGQVSIPSMLNDLAIEVIGKSREFAFTNKQSAFYYGETQAANVNSWQGFNVFGHEFLDDYALTVNGRPLDRTDVLRTIVYPDHLERYFLGGLVEELRIADSIAGFAVVLRSAIPVDAEFRLLFTDALSPSEFILDTARTVLVIARRNHPARTVSEDYPVWLAVTGDGISWYPDAQEEGNSFSPVVVHSSQKKVHRITFTVGDTQTEATEVARRYSSYADEFDAARVHRLARLLDETVVKTTNRRFDKALAWAKLSLDALIMNQKTRGIFAGLPWFNNYWGRDTFISLPGACLVTGRFALAKEILQSFADWQQRDSTNHDYGRIPNIVTTTDKAYNTADGTPRFVSMVREYVERSGDTSMIAEMYPIIVRSIDGTMKYHVDSLGFLTHGDAETWMDAVGPDGPWSPRGNRANDIQALWAAQLESGVWCANLLGDGVSAQRWTNALARLRTNFSRYFISDNGILDHLNHDGSSDTLMRPNQMFCLSMVGDTTAATVLRNVTGTLVYPYGVASLSQNDENFHPYHQYGAFYPKDAAYHNGTVWTWLQGAAISGFCRFGRQDRAAVLTLDAAHQILDRGAVGTQSELLDAIPRQTETEPRLSGTFSQAWNLAEFVRNFYDDYLGIRVERFSHTITLRPHLPMWMDSVHARIFCGGPALELEIIRNREIHTVRLSSHDLRRRGRAAIELPRANGTIVRISFDLLPQSDMTTVVSETEIRLTRNGVPFSHKDTVLTPPAVAGILGPLTFATPTIRSGLRALRGPDYPLLTNLQVKTQNPEALTLVSASDPLHDDVGNGAYTYPASPYFKPGSFDITDFAVSFDKDNVYFSITTAGLSDPGWHPEYGFQLSFFAIAIDTDGKPGSGTAVIPHNAHYTLSKTHAYERLIAVGGGVRIEDESGTELAAYVPVEEDVKNPLGDTRTRTIRFAVPQKYLGRPDASWSFTLLSGAQDDHGGAGLGEFRIVNKVRGEWNGGGKQDPNDPNVYDVLMTTGKDR